MKRAPHTAHCDTLATVMTFRSPCDRCFKVRFLDQDTGLCVKAPESTRVLAEMDTCFEWARYHAATDLGVMDDLEDAA